MPDDHDATPPQQLLPFEIKDATRERHNTLNRLITPRIRLCLPPSTQTTHLYVLGLTVFGNVYSSFEREWLRILDKGETYPSRMVEILQIMHIPELLRSSNLGHELTNVKFKVNINTWQKALTMMQAHKSAIETSIHSKPHTLLAYMWVSYMALFNGGRMIRDQLVAAPPAFWQCSGSPSDFEESQRAILTERLQFWYFGIDDGRAIKEDFKKRFDLVAARLTASERVDVVDEAVRIFEMLREMVDWLDTNAQAGVDANQDSNEQPELQHSAPRRLGNSAVVLLLLGVWDFVWGILVFMCTYFFGSRTRHKVEIKKTETVESETDTPEHS
jgi:heme oxygenase